MSVASARSFRLIAMVNTTIASSATATAATAAFDLANYFPVGKREVKFIISSVMGTTATGFVANVTIQESTSTTTTDFTNILAYDGSTVTVTTTDGTNSFSELHGIVSKRYIRAIYNAGQATSGATFSITAGALPLVRAM